MSKRYDDAGPDEPVFTEGLTDDEMLAQAEEHNVDCCYLGGYGVPYYQPSLSCSCGECFREKTWRGAGARMDQHMKDVAPEKIS